MPGLMSILIALVSIECDCLTHLKFYKMMKYIQTIIMGLAISLAPVAAISNDFWVVGIMLNVGVTAAAMWATFEPGISGEKEAKLFSTLLWGGLALQFAWAIVVHA